MQTHEVLPAIRKAGGYIRGAEDMSKMEILSKALDSEGDAGRK